MFWSCNVVQNGQYQDPKCMGCMHACSLCRAAKNEILSESVVYDGEKAPLVNICSLETSRREVIPFLTPPLSASPPPPPFIFTSCQTVHGMVLGSIRLGGVVNPSHCLHHVPNAVAMAKRHGSIVTF